MEKKVLVSIGEGTNFSEYARLLLIDVGSRQVVDTFDYRHRIYERSTKGFTGIFRGEDGVLWVCTETEIFKMKLPGFQVMQYRSCHFFNDVHYCYYDQDGRELYVANTGLDSVEIFDENLEHKGSVPLASHNKYTPKVMRTIASGIKIAIHASENKHVNNYLFTEDKRYKNLDERIRFEKVKKHLFPKTLYNSKDLRYVLFRPHILHPNFVTKVGDTLLVTLKNTGEIIEMCSRKTVISGLKGPHDGAFLKNKFLITESGTGKILYKEDVKGLRDIRERPMQEIKVCSPDKGFIRGIDMLDDHMAIAAVSKRREIKDEQPAWLALIDLKERKMVDRIDIPEKYGTNPFSVIDVTECF